METFFVIVLVFLLLIIFSISPFIKFYVHANVAGAPIPLFRLIGMKLRGIPVEKVVFCYIHLRKCGIDDVATDFLEIHALAGGDIEKFVIALATARENGLNVSVKTLSAMDLAGVDVVEAVKSAIEPHTVYVPAKSDDKKSLEVDIEGGVRLKIRVEVEVLTKLELLVGGKGEDVLVDRVTDAVQWIVAELNTTDCERISEELMKQNLDKRLSVEVKDVDVFILAVEENNK